MYECKLNSSMCSLDIRFVTKYWSYMVCCLLEYFFKLNFMFMLWVTFMNNFIIYKGNCACKTTLMIKNVSS